MRRVGKFWGGTKKPDFLFHLHGEGGGLVTETVRLDPVLLELLRHAAELLEVGLALLGLGELWGASHAARRVRKLPKERWRSIGSAQHFFTATSH